jgi:hypothetical protein
MSRAKNRISVEREARYAPAAHAQAVRAARLQRDFALSPAERLEKLAVMCRQAEALRTARRLP